MAVNQTSETVYQLKVTLKGSSPLIWRRLRVPGNITLNRLHLILQAAMGWTNSHLYEFTIAGTKYNIPDPDDEFSVPAADSRKTRLSKVLPNEKSTFFYEYDFGDSWEHEITVEKILAAEPGIEYPLCIDGKNACPPEDCGGILGYYEVLKVLHGPKNKGYRELMDWLGGTIDPEEFDIFAVNLDLQSFRRKHKANIPDAFRRAFET